MGTLALSLPPLKDRPACIPPLAEHFIQKADLTLGKHIHGITDDAMEVFRDHDWPGNVREMEHVIAYAIALSDFEQTEISFDLLPPYLKRKYRLPIITTKVSAEEENATLQEYLHGCEKRLIMEKARHHNGNMTKIAAALGISRQNLQYRVRRLQIQPTKMKEEEI